MGVDREQKRLSAAATLTFHHTQLRQVRQIWHDPVGRKANWIGSSRNLSSLFNPTQGGEVKTFTGDKYKQEVTSFKIIPLAFSAAAASHLQEVRHISYDEQPLKLSHKHCCEKLNRETQVQSYGIFCRF